MSNPSRRRPYRFLAVLLLAVLSLPAAEPVAVPPEMAPFFTQVDEAMAARIAAACPPEAPSKPAKVRRLLVFSRGEGFLHDGGPRQFHHSIPVAEKALACLGEKSGAWVSEVSYDYGLLDVAHLAAYDAIVLNSTTNIRLETKTRQALVEFVRGGKGLVALHSVVESFGKDEDAEMRKLIGGVSAGHPWGHYLTWRFKVEEPGHPLVAHIDGGGFSAKESMYQFDTRTSRANVRILLGMDMSDPATAKDEKGRQRGFRQDGLNPVAWIRKEGKGRVYVNAMGNNDETYWNPVVLRMHLAGIRYALGDLQVPDELIGTPSPK